MTATAPASSVDPGLAGYPDDDPHAVTTTDVSQDCGQDLFVELLDDLGLSTTEFVAVCHKPVGGSFTSAVAAAADVVRVVDSLRDEADVWFAPNPTAGPERWDAGRGRERDVTRWAALPADLDAKPGGFDSIDQAMEFIGELSVLVGTRPTWVIHSGHGLQPIWAIEDGALDDEVAWARAYRLTRRFGRLAARVAAQFCGAELDSVFSMEHLFRVPGTTNWKDPRQPVPVRVVRDTGGPLPIQEVEEFLDAWDAPVLDSDNPVTSDVVSDPDGWLFADADCGYVTAMVGSWDQESDRPIGGRHQWAMNRAVRLAAAHRQGCITHDGLDGALRHLGAALTHWCQHMGEPRALHPNEVRDAYRWAQAKLATFADERVRAELGDHQHGITDASTADTDAGFERAVETELHRLRVREVARQRLAWESVGAAQPLDAALLADILERPEHPAYRVEGLMPADGATLIVAQRKTGKTTLVLGLARSLLDGDPFLGSFGVTPVTGRVAILNYEVSGPQLARWADQVGIPHDRLLLVNLRGQQDPLSHPQGRELLAQRLRTEEVEALIVDPFGRAYNGGSQNDPGVVGAWLVDLDRFARAEAGVCDVILTTHAGWNGERTRGSSALEDWADSIITMTLGPDGQSRFLRAIGRDVAVDEDLLAFDPLTRTLTMTGSGSRKQQQRTIKAEALVGPACEYVTANPGASATSIRDAMRDLHRRNVLTVSFQDQDVRAAIDLAVSQGRLRQEKGGQGKATKHFPVDPAQSSGGETSSGPGR